MRAIETTDLVQPLERMEKVLAAAEAEAACLRKWRSGPPDLGVPDSLATEEPSDSDVDAEVQEAISGPE